MATLSPEPVSHAPPPGRLYTGHLLNRRPCEGRRNSFSHFVAGPSKAQRDEGVCPGSLCKWLDPDHDDGDGGDDGDLGPYIQWIFVA